MSLQDHNTTQHHRGLTGPLYVNGRFLRHPQQNGVNRYALELLRQWDRMLGDGEMDARGEPLVIVAPPARSEGTPFEHIPTRTVGRLPGNLWEQFDLPRVAAGRRLFSPCNSAPWLKSSGQLVTIHDASVFAVPYAYNVAYRLKHRLLCRRFARTAEIVITVSEFSKKELVHWCAFPPSRIRVIYSGCEHILSHPPDARVLERNALTERPFVLAMGSHAAHKNVGAILGLQPLLNDSGIDLVVAGGGKTSTFRQIRYASSPGVHWVGSVNDSELRALYERAALFVFPSSYEGFGFPPLEAMACGCPVVLSKSASLPELGGLDAVYCDPRDPETLAKAVQTVLTDDKLRKRLKEGGRQRARRFNWRDCARQTWAALQ